MAIRPKPTKVTAVTDVAAVITGVSAAVNLAKTLLSLVTSLRRK